MHCEAAGVWKNMKLHMTILAAAFGAASFAPSTFPDPVKDIAASTAAKRATAVVAGGCFWGVEAVFEHLHGVIDVVSGYAGGSQSTAHYMAVGSGTTGHAESVKVTYDPAKISYGKLLKVFFAVAHDPTELNRQGPDEGTQYRSSIFYADSEQQEVAEAYVRQLNDARVFTKPVVTTVAPLKGFYAAEPEHQNFLARHPDNPYIVVNDLPKLRALEAGFPELLKSTARRK
jgi:peptide-methionine (S)-S-oxide reductase